jgi:hypothetical protein
MSVTQDVRKVLISSDLPSFDRRSITEFAIADRTLTAIREISEMS